MTPEQRAAMEAANPYRTVDSDDFVGLGLSRNWKLGAEWMHAHDAEKVTLAEAYIRVHPHAREGKYTEIAQRIIAEAKEDTDGQ